MHTTSASVSALSGAPASSTVGTPVDHRLLLAGRVGLAAVFLPSGIGKLFGLAAVSGYIASKGLPFPMQLAIGAAVLEIAAGLSLLAGWRVKWAALALAAFTLLAAVLFHDFWVLEGMQAMLQRQSFFKNVGIVGGLLVLAAVGGGGFGVDRG